MKLNAKKSIMCLYCAVSVKSRNCFYIIHLFRKCNLSIYIYKSSDACFKNVRLHCNNPCCKINSHLLIYSDTWKCGDKNVSYQAHHSFFRTETLQVFASESFQVHHGGCLLAWTQVVHHNLFLGPDFRKGLFRWWQFLAVKTSTVKLWWPVTRFFP